MNFKKLFSKKNFFIYYFLALLLFVLAFFFTIVILKLTVYIDQKDNKLTPVTVYLIKPIIKSIPKAITKPMKTIIKKTSHIILKFIYDRKLTSFYSTLDSTTWELAITNKIVIDSANISHIEFINIGNAKPLWGIDFYKNHALISSVHTAILTVMENDKFIKQIPIQINGRNIVTRKNVVELGWKSSQSIHAGLHDIVFDPKYNGLTNKYIYLSMSLKINSVDKNCVSHAVVKVNYDYQKREILDNPITQKNILFETAVKDPNYCGNVQSSADRFLFLDDDTLLFSVGFDDNNNNSIDKRTLSLSNKILRMTKEGKAVCNIPDKTSNPFCDKNDQSRYIYSLGHKNVQGMTIDQFGNIYTSEHGERRGDEINLLIAGKDYGYPFLCVKCTPYSQKIDAYPVSYLKYENNPQKLHLKLKNLGYENPKEFIENLTPPLYSWEDYTREKSIAPSGLAHYGYDTNLLLVATLINKKLEKLSIKKNKIIRRTPLIEGVLVRDVYVYDEKTIYVILNKSGYNIWKILLKKKLSDL